MNYDEALRKAINCLKLSQSANQHEAALAASKAQEIIDRYNLSIDDVKFDNNKTKEPEEDIKDFGADPLHEVCQVDTSWTLRLGVVIANQNACRIYYHKKGSGSAIIKVIGRPSDVQIVRYVFGWLEREVRRITRQECQGYSRRYQIDFRTGVVDTIHRKLEQQRAATFKSVKQEATNSMALMKIENSIARIEAKGIAVDDWMKENMNLKEAAGFRHRADRSAREHGQEAGEQVRFNKAKGGLEAASRSNQIEVVC